MNRRLAFLITSLYKGGAETQLVRVATAMAARGWQVEILTLMDRNDFAPTLAAAGVGVHSLGVARGSYDPRALTRLVRLLRESRPTLLCTFLFHANVLGRVAGRLAGVPVVVSSIRNAVFGAWWADLLMRWTDGLAAVTTTNSELAGRALRARRVVSPARLRIMPNGIEVGAPPPADADRAALRAELGLPREGTVWLSVGRLEPQKAHDVALHAVARLVREGRSTHLLIVGEGAQLAALEELRASLGLEERVSFLGYRNDVDALMRAADGLLMASRWEGLPNVILEALVAGLPVVATDVGGVRELVEDGVSGLVVPAGDPAALAAALARLMDKTPTERRAFVTAGRAHVLERYALDQVMERWDALFTELVAGRDPRATAAAGARPGR